MIARAAQIVVMLGASALLYWAWTELNIFRGTVYFEYRFVIFLCGVFLVFSLCQGLAALIARLTGPRDD